MLCQAECRAALADQALALELPGAADAAGQLAQREAVNAFAHAGARVVLGRGHATMVAAAVFDGEVSVGGDCQHQARQPLFDRVVLVAQFVAGVDAQPRVGACDVGKDQQRPPRQVVRADPPGAADQRDEVQWHRGPGEPAVVAIVLQLWHHRFGRVVLVLADQRVEQRHQAVADQQRQRQADLLPARRVRCHAGERQQRVDDRQQPPRTLAVAVGDTPEWGIVGNVELVHARARCNGGHS